MKTYAVTSAPGRPVGEFANEAACAAFFFGSEAIVSVGFGMWMSVQTGEIIIIVEEV